MEKLLSLLLDAGAPLLVDIVRTEAPEPVARVVEALAGHLGTDATPDAIATRMEMQPVETTAAIREVEERSAEYWRALATAAAGQAALLAREDARESWFSWAWRPAMSWLQMALWVWNGVGVPIVNASGGGVAPIPWEHLIAFSGLWLAIYGGGHTIKSVMTGGKR